MSRRTYAILAALLAAVALGVVAHAQQPAPPAFATTKVDDTDGVYVFRNGNHQAMFVVTSAGVIATDPVGYGRPTGGQTYLDEIKKATNQPVTYLIYSHQQDASAAVKAEAQAGKCWDGVEKGLKRRG